MFNDSLFLFLHIIFRLLLPHLLQIKLQMLSFFLGQITNYPKWV